MADSDYICVYRQFFEEFAKLSQMEDCRQMRLNLYDLSFDELAGEVMQTCVNYLTERKCPQSLVVPLTKIVVQEFLNEAKKQPEEVDTPLKRNRKTHDKITEVCLRYTDNEKLSNLPAPAQETYYSMHSTKHTRRQMEDRHICLPRFNTLHSIQSNSEAGYYGIFDGHSGVKAACYASSHLHQFLAESEHYPDDPVKAFYQAFEKTDLKYNAKDENSGTTVLAILHQPVEKKLTVAWVGDSQAMLVNEDSYVMLVDPHKPERTDERMRVEALGGCIILAQGIYRVNGGLAISRAIGDKKLKPYVNAEPEIRVLNLTGSEHFIVMGCDGLWDVVQPQQVIETVYFEVKRNKGQIDSVGKRLVDLAKENNSTDNISVIVIFLTDPAEISNRSVDVTGHRPKILHQDGLIMEANFQTNDKPLFSDPGMNGVFESNGGHFKGHMLNESDEDFGPETDVDAVDDVLTSKNLNPFAKDCWPKTNDENSDKLIELPKNVEDDIMKFADNFTESAKPIVDEHSSQLRHDCDEMRSDMFSVDNMNNPFEISVKNNASEASDFLNNLTEDNNKYMCEINSTKEEASNFSSSDIVNQPFDSKINSDFVEESQEKKAEQELLSFDNKELEQRQDDFFTTPQDRNSYYNESIPSKKEEDFEETAVESPLQKESAHIFSSEVDVKEIPSNEYNGSHSNELNATSNEMDKFNELTLSTNEEAVDMNAQGVAPDINENPVLCSVIDAVEAARACDLYAMEKSVASKDGDEPSSELLSPSAPALEGELKDETVAESGGEVEDSEDDEWNYIKVESGVQQNITVDSQASDLIPSCEVSDTEKPAMNSPLNPEADEFIPVSAMSSNPEYDMNMTPKKAIPDDLTDIIASSPNWNNMNNISLPEESAFLTEIKSRPSNIFDNNESPEQENYGDKIVDANNSLNFIPSEETNKENQSVAVSETEPHGIDLATDMTSSFIDPSTMGFDIQVPQEKPDLMNSNQEALVVEKADSPLCENVPEIENLTNVETPSKLPDLLSPAPVQNDVSCVSSTVDTPPAPVSESVASDVFKSLMSDAQESKPVEESQVTMPSTNEEVVEKPEVLSDAIEKPIAEEKPEKTITSKAEEVALGVTAAAAAAAAATAVGVSAAKKEVKKLAPKTSTTPAAKTSTASKPLVNGTKTSTTLKKATTTASAVKSSTTNKTTGAAATSAAKPTSATPKTSSMTRTQPKSTVSASSTVNKAPARPRPVTATSAASKSSPITKTTVTSSPTKPATSTRTPGSTLLSTTLKAKPRVSSASVEKKSTSAPNGEIRSTLKRTEILTKTTGGATSTTTTTSTTTRVSLSARPTTAPAKPATLKTTVTTTRTITAKPRTTLSSSTTTSNTSAGVNKVSPTTRKSTIGADKQAKEVANRLTSKTASSPKTNGIQKNAVTTVSKTKKTLTSTTKSAPTKTKNSEKTENKAEEILIEKSEKIQNEAPQNQNNTDINLINSVASE